MDSRVQSGRIDKVVAERPHRARRLLSESQTALAADWLLGLGGPQLLGPVTALKWGPGVEGLEDGIAAVLWEVNDRLRFLELSMRVEQDPVGAQRRLEETVRDHGLGSDPEQ